MPDYLVKVTIPNKSAIPDDSFVNTWTFSTQSLSEPASSDVIGQGLLAFYNEITTFYSSVADLQNTQVQIYALADPEPRTPISEGILPVNAAAGGTLLPNEVALCLSFHALYVSGESQARRRGRLYLGPLNTGATTTTDAPSGPMASPLFIDALEDATAALQTALTANGSHCVYSRADNACRPVDKYFVQNDMDTQRRRGPAPTVRRVWEQGTT